MSDIHGMYDRYMKMLDLISLKDDDTLFVLGDVIDRGDDGIRIIQDLMRRKNALLFLGNHEWMMLAYLEGLKTLYNWLSSYSGGMVTLASFSALAEEEQNEIYEYLRYETALVIMAEAGGREFMLSHAGFTYERENWMSSDVADLEECCDLLFGNDPFSIRYIPAITDQDPLTYIVGHLETGRISGGEFGKVFLKTFNNGMTLIDIDTGCEYGEEGVLTCICLDDGRFFTVSQKDMR